MHYRIVQVFVCLIITHVHAQNVFEPPADSARLKIEAIRINHRISLDGRLDEMVWQHATLASNFLETWPSQLKSAKYPTTVRVLFDSLNLYIGAVCFNPMGRKGLRVEDMRRDFSYSNSESFAITLDPYQDVRNPIPTFLVTPFGTQADQLSYDDRIVDTNWDAVWNARCTITDSAWIVEVKIPFASIRYPSGSRQWRINFSRLIRNQSQIVGWSPWPLAFTFSRTTYAGHLNNINPPSDKLNLRLQPYVLGKLTDTDQTSRNYSATAGGEIKWGINPNTILEGTVNTDFAQADVDRQVINLNRSSVFFPERRQFFLENANLFLVGIDGVLQPFFSRNIGRNPFGYPLRIEEGMRLIHQNSKRAVGALVINQKGDTTVGGSAFGVVRGQINLKKNFRLGAMGILRHDESFGTASRNLNSVAIADAFWRPTQSVYIRPMISYSKDSQTGNQGMAGTGEFNYTGNHVSVSLLETIATRNYRPATGFAARNDFINTSPSLFLTFWNRLPTYMIYFRPFIVGDVYHTASTGKFQEATWVIAPVGLVFKGYHRASISVIPSCQQLTTAFEPVNGVQILPGRYHYTRFQFSYDGNLSAPYSLACKFSSGGFYNGHLTSYFASLRLAPIPHISMVFNYTRNDFSKIGDARQSFSNELLAPEIRLAMNANLQLSGFYQYNTATQTGALNARFSWQYRPLSFIYLVYNDLRSLPSAELANRFQQQTAIIKISYIRQL